ncbi:MAG: LamG-like jellyroll fold domain-containing protein [Planctomycetota bacterium]
MSRRISAITALVLIAVLAPSVPAQPLVRYTFDDGTATGIFGNGGHGVLLGDDSATAEIVSDPERGGVLKVGGRGIKAVGPFAITTSFTLSGWIKIDQPRVGRAFFGGPAWSFRTAGEAGDQHYWIEARYPGNTLVDLFDTRSAEKPRGQLDGQWHHYAFVLDEDGWLRVYFDGISLRPRDGARRAQDYGAGVDTIFFGTENSTFLNALEGYMDELHVFNYPVAPEDIADLMTSPSDPREATDPDPANGQYEVPRDGVLNWRAGREAAWHELYISTNADAVVGGLAHVDTVVASHYAYGSLDLGQTYYWKVNEIGGGQSPTVWKGQLWSFTTQEYRAVDNFEGYTNDIHEGEAIFQTWIDGWENDTGSVVGYFEPPFTETTIVYTGANSMPLAYDNTAVPWYSEAERRWAAAQNWTAGGADTLVLHIKGAAANDAETLYVVIEDNRRRAAVVVHPDPQVVRSSDWQAWRIPFAAFGSEGMYLTSITRLVIGLGTPGNPTPGGSGLIYIDDILVGRPAP